MRHDPRRRHRLAERLGVDFVGLVFVRSSPRCVTIDQARALRKPSGQAKVVGVFDDADLERPNRVAAELALDFVQLHGRPDLELRRSHPAPVIQAFCGIPSRRRDGSLPRKLPLRYDRQADGRGTMDVDAAAALPRRMRGRIFLAGGLTPENVGPAVERVAPLAVDCAGASMGPGVKDPVKMQVSSKICKTCCHEILGRFDKYGGCYVTELLMPVLSAVEEAFLACKDDPDFNREFHALLEEFAGRPTPLTEMSGSARRGDAPWSSNGRTCCTAAPTRPTTSSARRCWPGAWAEGIDRRDRGRPARRGHGHGGGIVRAAGQSLYGRQGRRAAISQRPAHETLRGRGRRRSPPDRRRSRTPSTRRCDIGPRTAGRRITSSAPPPDRIPSPASSPIFRASSERKPASSA